MILKCELCGNDFDRLIRTRSGRVRCKNKKVCTAIVRELKLEELAVHAGPLFIKPLALDRKEFELIVHGKKRRGRHRDLRVGETYSRVTISRKGLRRMQRQLKRLFG